MPISTEAFDRQRRELHAARTVASSHMQDAKTEAKDGPRLRESVSSHVIPTLYGWTQELRPWQRPRPWRLHRYRLYWHRRLTAPLSTITWWHPRALLLRALIVALLVLVTLALLISLVVRTIVRLLPLLLIALAVYLLYRLLWALVPLIQQLLGRGT